MTKDKFEVMDILQPAERALRPDPVHEGDLAEKPSLRETGTVVEVDHPTRGKYLDGGQPDQAVGLPGRSDRARRLLGEHTDEILAEVLGYTGEEMERVVASGAVGDVKKIAAE